MSKETNFETFKPIKEERPESFSSQEMPEEEKPVEVDKGKELKDVEEESFENLTMQERFKAQHDFLVEHYKRAYETLPNASRDRKEVIEAIKEQIETKGYFVPTEKDRKRYQDPALADNALEIIVKRWKEDTIRDILKEIGI